MALKSYITALHLTVAGLADPGFIHISPVNYLVHFKYGINLGNKTIQTALLARAVTLFSGSISPRTKYCSMNTLEAHVPNCPE
jgi:hypothetical protein